MNVYLERDQKRKRLMVHGKPFIMFAGEVHNSNSSSSYYMEQVWDKAEELGMNCLLVPVTWEMIEPDEGAFDFSSVDALIQQARGRGKKLVFLWFGAWKNAQCMYAPAWVKTDLKRFRRAEVEKGQNLTHLKEFYGMAYTSLSYLCEATLEADARAFRELMKYIKKVDEQENTVLMVQVENETGLKGAGRENSDEADALFDSEVPQSFVDYMKSHTNTMSLEVKRAVEAGAARGNWSEVFGDAAEEIFSAYHVAGYVGKVAASGKEVYPLPMTANCWLDKGEKAGKYPSGGPVSKMMEVWKYCAPAIDIIAPDIYVPDFCGVCDAYIKMGNPLFIPETATHSYAGLRQVYVVGHYHALCYAPFGFEEMGEPFTGVAGYLFGMDTTDPALSTPQNVEEYGTITKTLVDMMPLLTEKYGTSDLQAVISERKNDDTMIFGNYGFKMSVDNPLLTRKDGACLSLKKSEDEFYVFACGCAIMPFSANEEKPHLDILSLEEGTFENEGWKMIRRLNGDEAMTMTFEKPTLLKIKLFAYK